jgi:hypothetical protein
MLALCTHRGWGYPNHYLQEGTMYTPLLSLNLLRWDRGPQNSEELFITGCRLQCRTEYCVGHLLGSLLSGRRSLRTIGTLRLPWMLNKCTREFGDQGHTQVMVQDSSGSQNTVRVEVSWRYITSPSQKNLLLVSLAGPQDNSGKVQSILG